MPSDLRNRLTTAAYNAVTASGDGWTPEAQQAAVERLWDQAVESAARLAETFDPIDAALAGQHAPGDIARRIREELLDGRAYA